MREKYNWLISTIGKRGYIARYLRDACPQYTRVIGTGNDRYTPGFMSCDKSYVVPSVSAPDYLDRVLEICDAEEINAMLCVSDLDINYLPQIRDQLIGRGIHCFFPEQATAQRFLNKAQAAKFFIEQGFKTPATYECLEQALQELDFPFVIKPCKGFASFGFKLVTNEVEAREHWPSIESPIAQEYIEGRLVNVEACSDTSGRLLGISVWERLRSVAGETLLTRTIEHREAVSQVQKLLSLSPIPGPIDMDLIEVGGELYFLEINTRFGGGYPTSHLAGADFTGAMLRAIQGKAPREELMLYKKDVMMMKELDPVIYDLGKVVLQESREESGNA